MHVLTKFLVILAAILAILLSGLAIALTGNIEAVRSEFKGLRAEAAAFSAAAANAEARAGRARELHEQDRASWTSQLSQLEQDRNSLEGEVKSLAAENKRLGLSQQAYESRIDQFVALTEQQIQLAESRQRELQLLRNKETDAARKEIELTDRINDLEGETEVQRETIRALQEELVASREGDSYAGGSDSASGFIRAPGTLRARITDVRAGADGTLLVSIDAGSNDLLRERMKVNVVRNGDYLGSVVLQTVDLNESVGRVVLRRDSNIVLQPGDLVLPADL